MLYAKEGFWDWALYEKNKTMIEYRSVKLYLFKRNQN